MEERNEHPGVRPDPPPVPTVTSGTAALPDGREGIPIAWVAVEDERTEHVSLTIGSTFGSNVAATVVCEGRAATAAAFRAIARDIEGGGAWTAAAPIEPQPAPGQVAA
jgi:hypothetical protein